MKFYWDPQWFELWHVVHGVYQQRHDKGWRLQANAPLRFLEHFWGEELGLLYVKWSAWTSPRGYDGVQRTLEAVLTDDGWPPYSMLIADYVQSNTDASRFGWAEAFEAEEPSDIHVPTRVVELCLEPIQLDCGWRAEWQRERGNKAEHWGRNPQRYVDARRMRRRLEGRAAFLHRQRQAVSS